MKQIQVQLERAMPHLAKHQLEELTTRIRKVYTTKFSHHSCKYGNLNKGFTEKELQAFFFAIDNDEFRLIFGYMANLGFRIGEVVKLSVKDINFDTREIKLKSEKSRKLDSLIIPSQLFQETLDYIEQYRDLIMLAQGYLFFADKVFSKTDKPYINPDYVRKKFRHYVRLAGLDETYDKSEEKEGRAQRTLHRLTTHSLRHYSITRFARFTKGNLVLCSRFARHSSPNTTMIYINTDKSELYEAMERISNSAKVNL